MSNLAIHHKFTEFLSQIYLYRDKNVYTDQAGFDNITNKIYSITSYIHNRYTEDISLASLSK